MSRKRKNTKRITISHSQTGFIGDHAHIEGGIHFYGSLNRMSTLYKQNPRRFVVVLLGMLLLTVLAGMVIAGAVSPDIRQALFLQGLWPHAFPKERKNEVLIVVANFQYSENLPNTEAHNEIKRAIEKTAGDLDFATLRVEVDPNTRLAANNRAGAQALGDRYDASLIIWGADTGVRVSVNFYNRKQPDFEAADVRLEETARTQIAAPGEYAEFVTQDLPAQLVFLSLFAVGQSYFAMEDYATSVQVIEAATAYLGNSSPFAGAAEAYFRLGWLYSVPLPNAAKALVNYNRAIELSPGSATTYSNRGAAYAALGDEANALADFTYAIKLAPTYAAAFDNRGHIYRTLGRYTDALTDHNRAIELNPEYAPVYLNRALTYRELGDDTNALADYNRAIELDPAYALAYLNRGVVYHYLGNNVNALADYTHAIELDPTYALAYSNRGITYDVLGDNDNALADYNQAIKLDPMLAQAYYNRGRTYRTLNDDAKALADYNQAIELNLVYTEAYLNRGHIYYDLDDFSQALSDFNRTIELDPQLAVAYFNRGNAYFMLDDYSKALADYTRAIELDSEYVGAYYWRGKAYQALDRIQEARADFEYVLETSADADWRAWAEAVLSELNAANP